MVVDLGPDLMRGSLCPMSPLLKLLIHFSRAISHCVQQSVGSVIIMLHIVIRVNNTRLVIMGWYRHRTASSLLQ